MRPFLHSALLLLATASAPAFASTVISRSFHSGALAREWNYTIYLPTGYRQDGEPLPVLYLLHGLPTAESPCIIEPKPDKAHRPEMSPVAVTQGTGAL